MRRSPVTLFAAAVTVSLPQFALAADAATMEKGRAIAQRAIAYLHTQQQAGTGGWPSATKEGAPALPAISGLALTGILMDEHTDHNDPKVRQAAEYILSFAKPDGGIHDGTLENYNTSICVSALSKLKTEEARAVVKAAVPYLKGLQWGEDSSDIAGTGIVGMDHPFYGGVGYGSHGRPDNSNLNMMLTALQDAGVKGDDPTVQRALVFLQRTQMFDEVNDMPYADGSSQGGFIYATGPNKDQVGKGESKGEDIDEALADGASVSRLRAYGSMTYAGFKSYLYANLSPDDPRVTAAMDWIKRHYTLEENPGVGTDGYYYYLCTFGRALDAAGIDTIDAAAAEGSATQPHDWRADLIDKLASMQNEDGSFKSIDDRWMENNPILITSYALIALEHAIADAGE